MIEPRLPETHRRALRTLFARLDGAGLHWALTGSTSFRLQGVDVPVHDIDVQTDRAGALEIERLFPECSRRKVVFSESERIRSWYGALEIEGVEVEIMGDLQKCLENGAWEDPVDVEHWKIWVNEDGMRIPVLDLAYEYHAYLRMGRLEKAELLRRWLLEHGRRMGENPG